MKYLHSMSSLLVSTRSVLAFCPPRRSQIITWRPFAGAKADHMPTFRARNLKMPLTGNIIRRVASRRVASWRVQQHVLLTRPMCSFVPSVEVQNFGRSGAAELIPTKSAFQVHESLFFFIPLLLNNSYSISKNNMSHLLSTSSPYQPHSLQLW